MTAKIEDLMRMHGEDVDKFQELQRERETLEKHIQELTTQKAVAKHSMEELERSICKDLGLSYDGNFDIDQIMHLLEQKVQEEHEKVRKYEQHLKEVRAQVDEAIRILGD